MERCGAKLRGKDQYCRKWPVKGGTRCEMHGGRTPRGRSLPQTTHGRYSKDLPTRLAAKYAEAKADPDLLNLSDEIQLARVLLVDAMRGIDTGEAGRLWHQLRETWDDLKDAQREKDGARVAEALNTIGQLIGRGVADHAARQEVLDTADRVRKLVESEGKRRVSMQQMITAERLTVLASAIIDTVVRHVDDPDARLRISTELGRLLYHDGAARD